MRDCFPQRFYLFLKKFFNDDDLTRPSLKVKSQSVKIHRINSEKKGLQHTLGFCTCSAIVGFSRSFLVVGGVWELSGLLSSSSSSAFLFEPG